MLPLVRALSRSRGLLLSLGFLVLALAGFIGCGKTDSSPAAAKLQTPDAQPLLKFHWLGKHRLSTEANATNFMAIWNLPESARLEAQTLDKLASAPWRLWQTNVAVSNAPTALLRPLLEDLVNHEVYVEAQGETNVPPAFVLALRLPADRFALWQTNLAPILSSLFATNFAPSGPSTIFHLPSATLTLSRSNDWTLLSFTPSPHRVEVSASTPDPLLAGFCARLATGGNPFPSTATNEWLNGELDLTSLNWLIGNINMSTLPRATFLVTGDGDNVRTRGDLIFTQSLSTNLPAWNLPFRLSTEPLIGLTALRSYKLVLSQLGVLSLAQADQFPEQFMAWMRSGPPLQLYFAYPAGGYSGDFFTFGQPFMEWINTHADPQRFGAVSFDAVNQAFNWQGLQFCAPFLRLVSTSTNSFVHGGFGFGPISRQHWPEELHQHIIDSTNLIYFDWEHTADTLPQWRYFDDVSRMIFDAAHIARLRAGQPAIVWIEALLQSTKLSHCLTEIRIVTPHRLVLTRKSTLGLSALELNLLANWVELPDFPGGMSSLWRTNPAPFVRVRRNPGS